FFAILELFRREVTIDRIHSITKIDPFFLKEMKKLITFEQKIENEWTFSTVTAEELLQIKQAGFTNRFLCEKWNCSEAALQERLLKFEIMPTYSKITAYSADQAKDYSYFYTTWQKGTYKPARKVERKVLMVGSGPIQIGQGIEFDYCSVHGVLALQKEKYETVLINN